MKTVTVTGASGFVASQLVKTLLEKGFHVKATVRSLQKKEKVGHLIKLGDALPGQLELVEADLLKEGSFDDAVQGAQYVFHTASPYIVSGITDPQKELIEPAVQGSLNVLRSVAKAKSVKRVVLTSSIVAVASVAAIGNKSPPEKLINEEMWNHDSKLEDDGYSVSKTQAEEAAWKFAKENNIDLVTILPGSVMGPVLSDRSGGTSVQLMKSWLDASDNSMWFPYVGDVRDVALAHVRAAVMPSANGRYLITHGMHCCAKEAVKVLREAFPEYNFPETQDDTPHFQFVDNSRAEQGLGLHLTPVSETIVDMASTLIATGIAQPKPKETAKAA